MKRFFRRLWDAYPKKPLVYVCSHNGVTGVVKAEDFDDEVRTMRRIIAKEKLEEYNRRARPQVYPVFLFSDNTAAERDMRIGSLADLEVILEHCMVEERVFELPPLRPGMTPFGYGGLFEETGREGCRHLHVHVTVASNYLRGVAA